MAVTSHSGVHVQVNVYLKLPNNGITTKMYSKYMHRVTKEIKITCILRVSSTTICIRIIIYTTVCYRSVDSNISNQRILLLGEQNLNQFMPYALVIMSMVDANVILAEYTSIVSPTCVY